MAQNEYLVELHQIETLQKVLELNKETGALLQTHLNHINQAIHRAQWSLSKKQTRME